MSCLLLPMFVVEWVQASGSLWVSWHVGVSVGQNLNTFLNSHLDSCLPCAMLHV